MRFFTLSNNNYRESSYLTGQSYDFYVQVVVSLPRK